MHIYQPTKSHYPEMIALWEASARATHHFLSEEDIQRIKPLLPQEFDSIAVYLTNDDNGAITGMLGLAGDKLEMLFLHPNARGKGIGKHLVNYAIKNHGVKKVEVNEQNPQAIGFYQHMGFKVISRREVDDQGNAFPLLEMELS